MPEIARPLLVGGERLKEEASNPAGRKKAHRFTYADAQARLLPQIRAVRQQASSAGTRRTSEFVFRATLWPDYLAASFFPERLFAETGLAVVGSTPATLSRPVRGVDTPSLAKSLYLAGSDDDLQRLDEIVARQPPAETADAPENALWNAIRTLALVEVPSVETVLRERVRPTDMATPTVTDPASPLLEHPSLWECVLHHTRADDEALTLFAETVRAVGGETRLENRLLIGGLIYAAAFLPPEAARVVAALNPLRVVRPVPAIRPVFTGVARAIGAAPVAAPADMTPITEHRVAVFDGGVDTTCPLTKSAVRHIDLTPTPVAQDARDHGSVVTNALLFGYVGEGEPLRRPEFGVDHYRVWPPPARERSDPDLFWVLREILSRLVETDYRVVVLCLAPEQEVDEGTPHPWTAALDEIARELGGKLTVAKINIDHNQQTPKRYGVRGIPTLMIFKDGQVAATKIGNMPKRQLADWVDSAIA